MLKDPPVVFSPWVPWADRNLITNAHLPGVYLLLHREAGPPSWVDPLDRDIVFIGETTDGSLMGRWQQFHRAAFQGKPGHSGGLKYRETFGDEGEWLYVAAFAPEGLSRDMRSLYIRYVADRLIWEWARSIGSAPVCNAK